MVAKNKRYEIVAYNGEHLGWAKNLDDAQIDINAFVLMGYSFNHIIDQKRLAVVPSRYIEIGNGRGMVMVEGASELPGFGMLYQAEQRKMELKEVA